MAEKEGVIKYQLDFTSSEALQDQPLAAIQQWRLTLYQLGLIGQDPKRYGGLGYGNISLKMEPATDGSERISSPEEVELREQWTPEESSSETTHAAQNFIISGTQTGDLDNLTAAHYALVQSCDPVANHIVASGPIKPSSEALTHGAIYALNPEIKAVIHVHSPEIWQLREKLLLPSTPMSVPYGTPEMAEAVQKLWRDGALKQSPVLVMGGHEDGIISFGRDMTEAGMAMINTFQWARGLKLAEDVEAGRVEVTSGF